MTKVPEAHRRQPTRNRMGWSSNQLNALSQIFVDDCGPEGLPVLDLGAAYGVAAWVLIAVPFFAVIYFSTLPLFKESNSMN